MLNNCLKVRDKYVKVDQKERISITRADEITNL